MALPPESRERKKREEQQVDKTVHTVHIRLNGKPLCEAADYLMFTCTPRPDSELITCGYLTVSKAKLVAKYLDKRMPRVKVEVVRSPCPVAFQRGKRR